MTNHLWQSTLFAVVVGLLALALQKNRAAVRYWLWFGTSIKFLVPLSLLASLWIPSNGVPAPKAIVTSAVTLKEFVQPFPEEIVFTSSVANRSDWIRPALLTIWAGGFLVISGIRLRTWLHVRRVVQASIAAASEHGVGIRFAPGLLEPGVVGIWKPVLLLPADIEEYLSPVQYQAVLAHEQCHIDRRDNLTSAIHMLVEAIFWFHPLVWWIGSRLVEERERACDEEVLRLGGEPRDYADAIVNVCKRYIESPLACISGVTGADLKRRIEAIMIHHGTLRLNWSKKFLLVSAGLAAACIPFVIGVASAQSILSFEVASIRLSNRKSTGSGGAKGKGGADAPLVELGNGRFGFSYNTYTWILHAYGIQSCILTASIGEACPVLLGGPDWLKKDVYDIKAKIPLGVPDYEPIDFLMGQAPEIGQMLQTLLSERFDLKFHRETRELPVYTISVAKNGPKLRRAQGGVTTFPDGSKLGPQTFAITRPVQANGDASVRLYGVGLSMQRFAERMSGIMDRLVLNRTDLAGEFDITVQYAKDLDNAGFFTELHGPELFTAFQEQLGLKLDAVKAPVEVLVIDSIERPSEN